MRAFLTGSQIYGNPSPESDVDLVIFTDQETVDKLVELSDNKSFPIKFGRLNLIITKNEAEYTTWYAAKKVCLESKLIDSVLGYSRDTAVTIHKNMMKMMGTYNPFNASGQN